MKLLSFMSVLLFLTSCNLLYKPNKGRVVVRHSMRQLSDGWWLLTIQRGYLPPKSYRMECKPTPQYIKELKKY